MGRYYTGDIEGKFWVAVQSSDDADYFKCASFLAYDFNEDDIPTIEEDIKNCLAGLGKNKAKLDAFFETHEGYNDDMLVEAGFRKNKVKDLLKSYARLELGTKILNCVKERGSCFFNAEL
jgi:hypothetical protein